MINDSNHFFFDNSIIFVPNLCSRFVLSHVTTLNVQWLNEFSNIVHHDHFSKVTFCLFQMIKLTILQNEIVDCSISSITKFRIGSFSNKICQKNLYSRFCSWFIRNLFFDIFEISKSFQEFVFNDSIDCTNKQFAVIGCFWGPRGHKSAINKCDESGSHEFFETKTTNIKKNKNNKWKKNYYYQ